MGLKLANNASSTLSANILSSDTTISVQGADASSFPTLGAGDWFPLTLVDSSNNIEIVKATARSGATLTVVRGQEGTTARGYSSGDSVSLRVTKAALDDKAAQADVDLKAPLASPTFTGTPAAPTATAGTDSTALATTAFVQAALTAATASNVLAATGDVKQRYGTGAHTGWVRMNGRTIGNAASSATERANADCEELFTHLWTEDANLTVSSGRGSSAAADWAANKTIALPDLRERTAAGLADMGTTVAGRIADALVDGGGDSSTLGATAGASTHTLDVSETPSHDHGGTTGANGAHSHTISGAWRYQFSLNNIGATIFNPGTTSYGSETNKSTDAVADHSHTISAQGGDGAHNNVQPTMFMTWYVKL